MTATRLPSWFVIGALGLSGCDAITEPAAVTYGARDVAHTDISLALDTKLGTAEIKFAAPPTPPLLLETGDTVVQQVLADGSPVAFAYDGSAISIDNAGRDATQFSVAYTFQTHDAFDGVSAKNYAFTWPYFCGNMFPCVSAPADGMTFALAITGVPADQSAVYPTAIQADAPSYMVAFAVDEYVKTELGTTPQGRQVSAWHRAAQTTATMAGTASLVEAFAWLETTLGPYMFGDQVGSVIVRWGEGAYGGMEHHPFWHVASSAAGDEITHVHEAAHGWYGDGVRIACWEDFVLSEGTVSYLAARAIERVRGAKRAAEVWAEYADELDYYRGRNDPVWPAEWETGCDQIDILEDGLYTGAPYMRGAFFYKALADKLGADEIDGVLASFYVAHRGGAARMRDMLDHIQQTTGYNPEPCAQAWLRDAEIPTIGPCP